MPWAAPHRCSPSAAALTSVSKATGTPRRRPSSGPTSVSAQPGFGVVVTYPQVADPGRRSTGPNEPIPSAAIGRRAFDLGVTHFDLANNYGPPYGSAEENFGRLLAQDLAPYRDELVISTKAGYDMWPGPYGEWGSRKYLLASLDQSLRRLGLDYHDIIDPPRYDPEPPLDEPIAAPDTRGPRPTAPAAR